MTTPTPEPSDDTTPQSITALMLDFGERLEPVIDLVNGHREKLTAVGYSPTAAEVMSVELHRQMITAMVAPSPHAAVTTPPTPRRRRRTIHDVIYAWAVATWLVGVAEMAVSTFVFDSEPVFVLSMIGVALSLVVAHREAVAAGRRTEAK